MGGRAWTGMQSARRGAWWMAAMVAAATLWLVAPASAQEGVGEEVREVEGEEEALQESVHLQDVVNNPEYGPELVDEERPTADRPLWYRFQVRSELHSYNNVDLLPLLETSDQDVINTDDRHTFGYSTILASLQYLVTEGVRVGVSVAHNGLWGEDQLGQEALNVGVFSFYELAAHYTPVDVEAVEVTLSMGRQPYAIGGVPMDYVLDDILDGLFIDVDARVGGRLRILALDYYTANDLPDASFVRYIGGREPVLGLRGDTYTLRTGAVYENVDAALEGLSIKAYGFYSDIGGGPIDETGADISYGGSLGNFSDNDWTAIAGGRLGYTLRLGEGREVGAYAEYGRSFGIDRKEEVARDANTEGGMFGGGVVARWAFSDAFSVRVQGEFYHFDGAEYGEDGLIESHGFVGFKGRQIGGLAINRYAGWHPSAYVGRGGIEQTPQDVEREAGTEFIHAGLGLGFFEALALSFDWWMYTDTGSTGLDFDRLQEIDPPFGYSREEFFAQQRLGEGLGQEFNVQLDYQINAYLRAYGAFGYVMAGDFYETRINRVAGTAIGGDTTDMWGASGGAAVTW